MQNNMLEIYQKLDTIINCTKLADDIDIIDIRNIVDLTATLTAEYDESHDVYHHLRAYNNARIILADCQKSEDFNDILIMVTYAILLHDTIDHKYLTNIESKKNQLLIFLITTVGLYLAADIMWIIENMSYSKERELGYPVASNTIIQLARDIASDADKIEALGEIGIKRCREYTKYANPNLSESELVKEVIKHCNEKLLILHKFIRTKKGIDCAKIHTAYIRDYIEANTCHKKSLGQECRRLYPNKIPVIVNVTKLYTSNNSAIKHSKFMVDDDLTVAVIVNRLRTELNIDENKSMYAMINGKLVKQSEKFSTLYNIYKNEVDDCIHMDICGENTFGF